MKFSVRFFLIFMATILFSSLSYALPSVDGEIFGLYPISNEVSFLKNVDDAGANRGVTMQIIAINSFKLWTEFTFEFTADFNWDMAYVDDTETLKMSNDHYIELSIVKPIIGSLSLNYQRIYQTFNVKPINQFGLRLSF